LPDRVIEQEDRMKRAAKRACRAMDNRFQIGHRLIVCARGLTAADHRAIAVGLDPCPSSTQGGTPDVLIEADDSIPGELVDIQRDAGDGRLTATDGRRFYVFERVRACALPALGAPAPATFALQPGFPVAHALRALVRPFLQLAILARGGAAVHSAAVELDGRAVLVAGWSESGKTETALALVERGARFLSDKWTFVGEDRTATVFPITVGVRGWVLRYLPRLNAALRSRQRGRLRAAAAMRALTRPAARGAGSGVRDRALTLADRIAVRPSAVRELYADDPSAPWRAPLAAVALLTTVPVGHPVEARPADPVWAAQRLTLTADFERRRTFELHDRAQWSASQRDPGLREALMLRERALLERVLGFADVIEVKAPFPADPRPVAAAIARLL
jgi:hypothetical protein